MTVRSTAWKKAEKERTERVLGYVTETLMAANANDRHMLGQVGAYLLQWALTGLDPADREAALEDVMAYVRELLDGESV